MLQRLLSSFSSERARKCTRLRCESRACHSQAVHWVLLSLPYLASCGLAQRTQYVSFFLCVGLSFATIFGVLVFSLIAPTHTHAAFNLQAHLEIIGGNQEDMPGTVQTLVSNLYEVNNEFHNLRELFPAECRDGKQKPPYHWRASDHVLPVPIQPWPAECISDGPISDIMRMDNKDAREFYSANWKMLHEMHARGQFIDFKLLMRRWKVKQTERSGSGAVFDKLFAADPVAMSDGAMDMTGLDDGDDAAQEGETPGTPIRKRRARGGATAGSGGSKRKRTNNNNHAPHLEGGAGGTVAATDDTSAMLDQMDAVFGAAGTSPSDMHVRSSRGRRGRGRGGRGRGGGGRGRRPAASAMDEDAGYRPFKMTRVNSTTEADDDGVEDNNHTGATSLVPLSHSGVPLLPNIGVMESSGGGSSSSLSSSFVVGQARPKRAPDTFDAQTHTIENQLYHVLDAYQRQHPHPHAFATVDTAILHNNGGRLQCAQCHAEFHAEGQNEAMRHRLLDQITSVNAVVQLGGFVCPYNPSEHRVCASCMAKQIALSVYQQQYPVCCPCCKPVLQQQQQTSASQQAQTNQENSVVTAATGILMNQQQPQQPHDDAVNTSVGSFLVTDGAEDDTKAAASSADELIRLRAEEFLDDAIAPLDGFDASAIAEQQQQPTALDQHQQQQQQHNDLAAVSTVAPFTVTRIFAEQILSVVPWETLYDIATNVFQHDYSSTMVQQMQDSLEFVRQELCRHLLKMQEESELLAAKRCDPNVHVLVCGGACRSVCLLSPDANGHLPRYMSCTTPLDATGATTCGAYTCSGCECYIGTTMQEVQDHLALNQCEKAFHYSRTPLLWAINDTPSKDGARTSTTPTHQHRRTCDDNTTLQALSAKYRATLPPLQAARADHLFLRDILLRRITQCRKAHCPTCGCGYEMLPAAGTGTGSDDRTNVTCQHCATQFCYVCQRILPHHRSELAALATVASGRVAPCGDEMSIAAHNPNGLTDQSKHCAAWEAGTYNLRRPHANATCPSHLSMLASLLTPPGGGEDRNSSVVVEHACTRTMALFHHYLIAVDLRLLARAVGKRWFEAAVAAASSHLDTHEHRICTEIIEFSRLPDTPLVDGDYHLEVEADADQHAAAIAVLQHVSGMTTTDTFASVNTDMDVSMMMV